MNMKTFFVIGAVLFSALVAAGQRPELRMQTELLNYSEFFSVGDVKGKIGPARAILLQKPTYNDEARNLGADGTVRVEIVIAPDGSVASAKAVSGPSDLFQAAESAAMRSRFLPVESEIRGYLAYEFRIRRPNWFLVAFDLHAFPFANPGVIGKAIPADWTEERELVNKLIELRNQRLDRPVPGLVTTTGSKNRSVATATVTLPVPSANMSEIASQLREKIRSRLAGNAGDLRQFQLAVAFTQTLSAFRNPGSQPFATSYIRRFADENPENLPDAWIARIREFLLVESKLEPEDYRLALQTMIVEFRSAVDE
jgi:TonB family protein